MNDNDHAPIPFPTAEERSELVLEFQKLTAKLVRAGLLSRVSANRLVRGMNNSRAQAEQTRHALSKLVLEVLLAIDDGTLKEGTHHRRSKAGVLALHLESVAPALFRAQRTSLAARDMRRLFRFGWDHFREVVVARSERVVFGPDEDRRRAVVLNLAKAHEFIGGKPAVPSH